MKVLLVADDPRGREIFGSLLKARGAVVTIAANDGEAYEAIATGKAFDLLITEIHLGAGMTGFDVARSARVRQPNIPVVYLTAHAIEVHAHAVEGSRSFLKLRESGRVISAIWDFAKGD